MKQVINIILSLNNNIKKLRKKYDSHSANFLAHITITYPFEYKNQKKLKEFIKGSLEDVRPFKISLEDIFKSYPFIQFRVKNGKKELLDLRKKLNSGILKKVGIKKPLKYLPHMTIGIIEDKKEFNKAVRELKEINPKDDMIIKKIVLMTLKKDMTLKSKDVFRLR